MSRCLWALQSPSGSLKNNFDGTPLLYRRRRDALHVARLQRQRNGRRYAVIAMTLRLRDTDADAGADTGADATVNAANGAGETSCIAGRSS